ncbi:MAG: type 1 glutamine amidotransferase [Solirubrobacterales bacterium]
MPDRALIVKHVPWEGPHRIGEALLRAGFELDVRCVLDGDPLPATSDVTCAVFMGGPMNVDQIDRYPGLLAEREWITGAVDAGMPLLGVCLGSQLLARALGSAVAPGPAPEIGWAEVEVHGSDDELARFLAPACEVLHWHGDVFELPPGARLLASSAHTAVQGFRARNAWGFLFHAEADAELARAWMDEPSMRAEAEAALGGDAASITARAASLDAALRERTDPLFDAFARGALHGFA